MAFSSRLVATGLLVGVLSIATVHAQQDTTPSNSATPNTAAATATNPGPATVTRYDDRGGFDWGWLGLIGLAGLLGLRRPTNVAYRDRDRTYQDHTNTR